MSNELELLTLAEVERMVRRKKTWIYGAPDFPKPIKIGSGSRWLKLEVQAYIKQCIEQRDHAAQ